MSFTARQMIAVLAVLVAATTAAAQSQGPNSPASVVNDASFGVVAWALPGNAAVSDNMNAGVTPLGNPSQYLRATNFGFAIPLGAVIDGIEVDVERRSAAGTISDSRARIINGGVIGTTDLASGVNWPTTDTVITYGNSSELWGETWTAADVNSPAAGFVLSASDAGDAAFVDAISMTVFYSLCGDNQIGLSEQCDDGNTNNGDCCSSTCQFEPNGSLCGQDGNDCNGDETCDGSGACVSNIGPLAGCRTSQKGIFIYKNKSPNTKDKLTWKWIKGQATDFDDFGTPTGTTAYSLCIYSGTTALAQADIAPSASLWKVIGANKGYKYKDKPGSSDGITKAILKSGIANKAKALVKGKGDNLPDPSDPPFALPVTVQLVNSSNNICYTTTFTTAKKNQPGLFKAKSP